MSTARAMLLLACIAVAALVAVGLTQLPKSATTETSAPLAAGEQSALLSGSPAARGRSTRDWPRCTATRS
jgi:hypothetical protein